ncbi:Ornithine carbamoyltransferase, mitochondrial [Golovinomyces cichoracearum]|uniref:Ornithine carbamoyltransferase, mitochondrial n=1 Tax=Golovinomyces cichoracearum TaxID=62708 RepID=A0A420IW89_9PEZI|nr:Ornithine carbamoyltransferase, mitochondrial [Golovinomyces cichoracearum]
MMFRSAYARCLSHHDALRISRNFLQTKSNINATASFSSHSSRTPRHLLSIADLSTSELNVLVLNASRHKATITSGDIPPNIRGSLSSKTVAMMFSKRSTRTRVSTEGAITLLGGHPMFLGSSDIQLGVNESLRDTSRVISSMSAAMIARVGCHSEVLNLAKWSTVPVINALSNDFHPFQTIADLLTIKEAFHLKRNDLSGLKIAWIGDSNNVLFDLALGALKLGINISVASPIGYTIPEPMRKLIVSANTSGANFEETNVPEEAIKGADILVTDTWISMGQEEESERRLQAFSGFQITEDLAKRGGANKDWKFMHCLPRHQDEVDDDVFYGHRSLVFPEAENRLWSAVSVLEGFVVNKGIIA